MRTPVADTNVFDSPAKARVRKAVLGGLGRLGITLERLENSAGYVQDDSTKLPEMLAEYAAIPGMVPLNRCFHLYLMAISSSPSGDVIEIGSWQGRSTAFLARACADSDNGVVHAVDTFLGNPGTEHLYAVDGSRDSLEANFRHNIARAGLTDRVVTHATTSARAATRIRQETDRARLIFIDGEHTYDAVRADLAEYADLLMPGGLLVFDDYSPQFPGDVRAVREHVDAHPGRYARAFQQQNTLVLRRLAQAGANGRG